MVHLYSQVRRVTNLPFCHGVVEVRISALMKLIAISIIPELLAAMPDDVPDLAVTNHLLPLDLPSQFTVYLGHQPGGRYGVTSRGTLDMIRANRAMLRQFLATKIPCRMGKRAVSFEESSESVTVYFEDGTSATGSILVGADGANSGRKRKDSLRCCRLE